VALVLLLGTTRHLTRVANELDGVFLLDVRFGLLVVFQVLLALALMFAEDTEEGLTRDADLEAVADLPLMLHRELRCVALLFAIAHALAINDAEPRRTRRMLDVAESPAYLSPCEGLTATRRDTRWVNLGLIAQKSRLAHMDHDVLPCLVPVFLFGVVGEGKERLNGQGGKVLVEAIVEPVAPIVWGHRAHLSLQLGGEVILGIGGRHCLGPILYFAVFCVSGFTQEAVKIAVFCVMTYLGKALIFAYLFLT
jgi:hypothetical protein